jgi:hypothetical protein
LKNPQCSCPTQPIDAGFEERPTREGTENVQNLSDPCVLCDERRENGYQEDHDVVASKPNLKFQVHIRRDNHDECNGDRALTMKNLHNAHH